MADVGTYTVPGLRPVARPVARWAARKALTTARFAQIALFLAAIAAVWFTEEGVRGGLIGSAFLVMVLGADAVGAELRGARTDILTDWLVVMLSRLREYTVYMGLAIGGAIAGVPDIWGWAAAALIAHALRDAISTARVARPGAAVPVPGLYTQWPPRPADRPADRPVGARVPARRSAEPASLTDELLRGADPGTGAGGAAAPETERTAAPTPGRKGATRVAGHRAWARPLRWAMSFPAPERFALIAITVTIWDSRVTFIALVVASLCATAADLAEAPAGDPAR
ncbi:hypothetical protein CLV63_10964 [Murinocardiopsis flavida]|uniref:CDP-alcohol phosphatidyltransferase-like enzyme n=1 Tax=Murinocardiopsis flavida TaxID=645275 RepID=A0A2P8DIN7_9ACTN|nr:hypothetical protein [Murinocardiopsis flavida]PSK97061.1 hypothetical protein CLV63_10964 [Murinocardiopsis flavida]